MRKICLWVVAACAAQSSWAAGDQATITSDPSPAVVNRPVTVTVNTSDFGSEVYVYSWTIIEGSSKEAASWGNTNVAQYRMSGSNGVYTYRVEDIKSFYNLTDAQLAKLTKMNFIAKSPTGAQTEDLSIEVVQAPIQKYSGGEGTDSDPYLLSTTEDLKLLSTSTIDWSASFRLEADITAAGITAPIGNSSNPFKGKFDGNGKSIKNLDLTGSVIGNGTGLFGILAEGAEINDLAVIDATVNGTTCTGILAGKNGGTISRCYSAGNVSATSICVGGLVGENGGKIVDSYSVADVTAVNDYAVGGLVGKNTGTITNTVASGEVAGLDYVGGLVGANYGKVSGSVSVNSKITSHNNFSARFGGNNNSRNVSQGNYSWDLIPAGHDAWTEHGDHAVLKVSNELVVKQSYKELSGWDFDNVWDWKTVAARSSVPNQGPVLRSFGDDQPVIFPTEFFNTVSSVEEVFNSGDIMVSVAPNPTEGILYVSSPVAIKSCSVFNLGGGILTSLEGSGMNELTLDLSGLAAGTYILRVDRNGTCPAVFKVIKK